MSVFRPASKNDIFVISIAVTLISSLGIYTICAQGGSCCNKFKNRPRRQCALYSPIQKGFGWVFYKLAKIFIHVIRVKTRVAGHGKHFARPWIHNDNCPQVFTQRFFCISLNLTIKGQIEVVTRNRGSFQYYFFNLGIFAGDFLKPFTTLTM